MSTDNRRRLGKLLAEARHQRKLTGEVISSKVGISQSKLSKLEGGVYGRIEPQLIQDILNILEASPTIRQRVSTLLDQTNPGKYALVKSHNVLNFDKIYSYEKRAGLVRIFDPNAVPALLQLPEYRTEVLKHFEIAQDALIHEAKICVLRQDLLWDTSKQFHFILQQTALYTAPAGPVVQVRQLDRLERMASRQNITLGVIPYEAGLAIREHGPFALYDQSIIKQAILGGEIDDEDTRLITEFDSVFAELDGKAAYDDNCLRLLQQAVDYFS